MARKIRSGLNELTPRAALQQCQVKKDDVMQIHHNAQQKEGGTLMVARNSHHQDTTVLVALLKECADQKDLHKGSKLHAHIGERGLLANVYIGTVLVSMYAKCGALAKAQEVFDELPIRNIVSWNALTAGYAQHGLGWEALQCFERMKHQGCFPNAVTFTCILKSCGSVGAVAKGEEIHAEVARQGLLDTNTFVGNALVDMYAKCGILVKAQEVFDELPVRDVVSWSALIAGYAQHGHGRKGLDCFERIKHEGLFPNAVTFVSVLKACGSIGAVKKGEEIHAEVVRQRLLENNSSLGNALVDMYGKCGAVGKAQEVFFELSIRNVVSWNALISGYVQHGHCHEALKCFERMKEWGVSPDAVTFTCILKACGSVGLAKKGDEIRDEVVRQGLLREDPILGSALVDMYVKCGLLAKAQEGFDELLVRNVVSWNALIAGYVQHGHAQAALECFGRMQNQRFSPDVVTFTCILKACGSVGAAKMGEDIHDKVVNQCLLGDTILGSAVIDMYGKCGLLAKAQEVFDELPVQDIVSWNALIVGYALLGRVETVIELFNKMTGEGIEPDLVTFIGLLNACSHSGLVEEAQVYFETMSTSYDLAPTLEHYACMVDLYSRVELFEKAMNMIEIMPPDSSNYLRLWSALLGACQRGGNVKLGRLAFEHVIQLNEEDAAAYVSMGNIYVAARM